MEDNLYRMNVKINPQVVARAKAQAVNEGTTLNRLVEKILDKNIPEEVVVSGNSGAAVKK